MTHDKLRKDLETIEKLMTDNYTSFMHDIFERLREITLRDLIALQIKEFNKN